MALDKFAFNFWLKDIDSFITKENTFARFYSKAYGWVKIETYLRNCFNIPSHNDKSFNENESKKWSRLKN